MPHAFDDTRISAALLGRYVAGECTADEVAYVQGWMARMPVAARVVETLEQYRANPTPGAHQVDADDLWRRIQSRVAEEAVYARPKFRAQAGAPNSRWRQFWYASAAVVIAVIGVVVGWSERGHHAFGAMAGPGTVYTTTTGERANITLPDGSTVALDVASRLEVPADFSAGHRAVRLAGAALFTVTHHEGGAFTVAAGTATAKVLGTSFVVRHYGRDTTTTVAVQDGKVAVGSVIVTSAHRADVGQDGIARLGVADESLFSFATGVLTLQRQPLGAAIVELNRWYAADIRLGDSSFARVPVKGRFAAGSVSDLASILELMLDARVVRDGQILTLYPKAK